jgi:UDP-2,3-diacylglucosamine pyrophosphatase LpxH
VCTAPSPHDLHLRRASGHARLQGRAAGDFLARNSCETLFLVGDIVDGWRLKRAGSGPRRTTRLAGDPAQDRHGTRVIYVPGNHDEVFRDYCGRSIAGVEILREAVHETADGKRLLVIHGDHFDAVIAYAKWLAHLGDWAYTLALELNEVVPRSCGAISASNYWSLSAFSSRR